MKLLTLFLSTQGFLFCLKLTDTQMTWIVALIPLVVIAAVFIFFTIHGVYTIYRDNRKCKK